MKGKSKRLTVPNTGSPVLDAWALAFQLERDGLDVWGALHGNTDKRPVEPPTRISSEGVPIISREEIQGMAPKRVAEYFYDSLLCAVMRGTVEWKQSSERLHELPQHWRLIYTVCWLQTEVDNGGHEQFFDNGRGEFDDETEVDLSFLGANNFLELYLAARKLFYNYTVVKKERCPEVEPLDDAFYKQTKSPYVLVGEYVLSHLADYCVD